MGLIKTKMRSMLYEARLPHEFWDYAVEHSVWLKNQVPTEALSILNTVGKLAQAITLYKAWNERLLNFTKLLVFDCAYYSLLNPGRNPNTFIPRILKDDWIYVGMKRSSFRKAYNIRSKKEIVDTDSDANEYNFLYTRLVS